MINAKIIVKYLIFLVGLFFMGLGVGLVTKANMGTSPISSLPYVLSMIFPITFGQFTILLSFLFLIIQIIILRKDFQNKQYLQIFVGPFFGLFVDLGMFIFSFINPDFYVIKVITLLIGCVVLALGVYLQVYANVTMNSGEALVKAIAQKTGIEFGLVKILFDCTLVLSAVVISLTEFGTIKGIGAGTIISAIIIGYIIKIFRSIFIYFNLERRFAQYFANT